MDANVPQFEKYWRKRIYREVEDFIEENRDDMDHDALVWANEILEYIR